MSIDELLGLSVDELKQLTDEQLMERYAPIFQLEQQAINNAVPVAAETSDDEGDSEGTEDSSEHRTTNRKTRKKAERKEKIEDLKNKLMSLSVDDDFK